MPPGGEALSVQWPQLQVMLPEHHTWQRTSGPSSSDPKCTFRSAEGSGHSKVSWQDFRVGIYSGKELEREGSSLKRQDWICVTPGMLCSHGAAEPSASQTFDVFSLQTLWPRWAKRHGRCVCWENRALAAESRCAPGACRRMGMVL